MTETIESANRVMTNRICIIVPALNEAETIVSVVTNISQYGLSIVVDDASNDDTGELAKATGATVIRHDFNQGYDHALNSGFACANDLGCECAITMDADGQHDPTILKKFIEALDDGADVVVGIRDRRQRFAEHIFAWIGWVKWGIRDPLCGMKAYRMGVYKELGHFDSYGSIGTELAIFASKSGKKIVQLPIKVQTREGTDKPRFGRPFTANMKILRALWIGVFSTTKNNHFDRQA